MIGDDCRRPDGGLTKRPYPTRAMAKRAAKAFQGHSGVWARAYRCGCGQFHITTSAKRSER